MGVRSTIDIDYGGIYLRGVEIVRFHHAVIQIGSTISGFDAAALKDGLLVVFPRIWSGEQSLNFELCSQRHTLRERTLNFMITICADQIDIARLSKSRQARLAVNGRTLLSATATCSGCFE